MINRWGWGLVFLSILLQVGCDSPPDDRDLTEALTGQWQNIDLKVNLHTVNNTDSSSVFEADEDSWEEKLRIQPILTQFSADSTYTSEYRDLAGFVIRKTAGTWFANGDSLFTKQLQPTVTSYRYKVDLKHNKAFFQSTLDWDHDGEEDDVYEGTQRKVRTD